LDSAAWPIMMISWSKLSRSAADWIYYNSLAGRSPMDLTSGKVFNSTKIPASLHSVITLRALVVIAAISLEPAESVWKQPSQDTQIG